MQLLKAKKLANTLLVEERRRRMSLSPRWREETQRDSVRYQMHFRSVRYLIQQSTSNLNISGLIPYNSISRSSIQLKWVYRSLSLWNSGRSSRWQLKESHAQSPFIAEVGQEAWRNSSSSLYLLLWRLTREMWESKLKLLKLHLTRAHLSDDPLFSQWLW